MESFDILDIIKNESITTYFQPIISLKHKSVIGFEALTRGICTKSGKIISPNDLFKESRRYLCDVELELLCRKMAFENYNKLPNDNYLLFLNIDADIIERMNGNTIETIRELVDFFNIRYNNIVLEIVESHIKNRELLTRITEEIRSNNMLLALDDFGALNSNLDRIVTSKPDIIKIDKELIKDVSKDYYKQSIVEMIKKLAQKIGSLTLAEGVEDLDDILFCYEIGVDLYQGYYFSKPLPVKDSNSPQCADKIHGTIFEIKKYLKNKVSIKKELLNTYDRITNELTSLMQNLTLDECFTFFSEAIDTHKLIECIYILDHNGKQVGDTICNRIGMFRKNYLFHPASDGADHSLKDYYFYINTLQITRYITEPYISLATGSVCRTVSTKISMGGEEYILCIDFFVENQNDIG